MMNKQLSTRLAEGIKLKGRNANQVSKVNTKVCNV